MHRVRTVAAAVVVALAAGAGSAVAQAPLPLPALGTDHPGLATLADATGTTTAIVTLDAPPTDALAGALGALGLDVQPMRRLPLAIVRGPAEVIRTAVATGLVTDAYADEPIELLDTASADAMGAAVTRVAGLTGEGVTVGVVDSGCDATHPDLADHVVHNVKLLSPEYVNGAPDSTNTIVLPIDQGPYSNTDLGSGHGTHVAGIIAADGTTSPDHLGVAPDAELVCVSIGEVLFTTAVVTAYDYLLDQPDLLDIDVINNSWGNSFAQFDPRNPVAVATRAVADQGVVVVFAAGNSGDGNGEATLNPFSQAPWVLSVAAETVDHVRGSFSSNGLVVDNSLPSAIGAGGVTTFTGSRIGLYHPDVAAPGVDISSTCDTTGAAVGPCPPGENTVASGTSMASPHVAGAVAVLLEANPRLTPVQVQQILQTTAEPVTALDATGAAVPGTPAPFWQVGFGRVDLADAAAVAASDRRVREVATAQRIAEERILRRLPAVLRTDLFTWDAPRVSLGTDVRPFSVPRAAGATAIRATVAFPSEATLGAGVGLSSYVVRVVDRATGQVLIATTEPAGLGSTAAEVALPATATGPFDITVTGERSVSDPDTLDSDSALGDTVTVQFAQLRNR